MRLKACKNSGFAINVGEYFEANKRVFRVIEKHGMLTKTTIYQQGSPVKVMTIDEEKSTYLIEDAITRQRFTMPVDRINQKIKDDDLMIVIDERELTRRKRR